ncbi:MAG: hypothetical protein M3140_04700 [Actinomycetota bacterium]|nr:hypothetical protein [Actinomycetota bacterium]
MILADTSAWIEYDRASGSPADRRLADLITADDAFDATLNWDVPQESGFPDEASAASWLADGRSLARRCAST